MYCSFWQIISKLMFINTAAVFIFKSLTLKEHRQDYSNLELICYFFMYRLYFWNNPKLVRKKYPRQHVLKVSKWIRVMIEVSTTPLGARKCIKLFLKILLSVFVFLYFQKTFFYSKTTCSYWDTHKHFFVGSLSILEI